LGHLKRFPIDALKIDRTFIRDAVTDPDDAAITVAIINLAHSLNLRVVAEGVETEAQLNLLRSRGCDEMQGFYFSYPLSVEQCTKTLAEDRRLKTSDLTPVPAQPRILIVDDNENDRELLEKALTQDGFAILTAENVQRAFELLAGQGIEVVVSDHSMPGMTGVEFLSVVKRLYPKIIRVVVSGVGDMRTLTMAVNNAGIHKYLSKDWEHDRWRAEISEAFQEYGRFP